jgi:hypothetical protein
MTYVIRVVKLPPLALGVCGDVFIMVYKLTDRLDFSSSAGVITLLAFAAMRFWILLTSEKSSQGISSSDPSHGRRKYEYFEGDH